MANTTVNTYIGGIDQDTHYTKYNPEKYYSLRNGHIIAHGVNSTGILENEPGNEILLAIPATFPVFEIGFLLSSNYIYELTGAYAYNLEVTIGTDVHTYNLTGATTDNTTDLYNQLIAPHASNGLGDYITATNIKIAQRGNKIVIFSLDKTITIRQSLDVNTSTALAALTPIVPSLSASTAYIIGVANMRNDLIIFSCNGNTGYGQIWKCSFNIINTIQGTVTGTFLNPKIHLFYNGQLNFSTANRIIDSVSKYENSNFAKIWFTDNNNLLRAINLNDPFCYSLSPNELEMIPDQKVRKPILNDISGVGFGTNLKSGVIEYFVQYYNNYGALSVISPNSKLIHITRSNEKLTTSETYVGTTANQTLNKAIKIEITADTNYDICRLIAVHYSSLNATPEIRIVSEQNIPNSGYLLFVDDGNESLDTLTTTQLNELNSMLFSCKNIIQKDNLLVAANINEQTFDIDFDARCFRYRKSDGTTYNADLTPLAEGDDINPYNNTDGEKVSATRYMYAKNAWGAASPSGNTIIGGTGIDQFGLGVPNISYCMKQMKLHGDFGNITSPDSLYVENNGTSTINILDGTTEPNKTFFSYASPYVSGAFTGYQRDEIYRFGIVFFNKKYIPSFVKWIADIRMPCMADYDDNNAKNGAGATSDSFNICNYDVTDTDNKLNFYVLYPEFTVNIPNSIKNQISGYSIVRVKRDGSDRRILAQGILNRPVKYDTVVDAADGFDNIYDPSLGASNNWWLFDINWFDNNVVTRNPPTSHLPESSKYLFYSPEINFNKNIDFVSTDTFKVEAVYDRDFQQAGDNSFMGGVSIIPTASYSSKLCRIKSYDLDHVVTNHPAFVPLLSEQIKSNKIGISDVWTTDYITEQTTSCYGQFNNAAGGMLFSGLRASFPGVYDFDYYLVNYIREPINRYGGNNISDRTNNEYIYCYNFINSKDLINNTTYHSKTFGVFGGDTYIGMYDYLRFTRIPYFRAAPPPTYIPIPLSFPIETSINLALRHDPSWSKSWNDSIGEVGNAKTWTMHGVTETYETGDLYAYNSVYSKQAETIKYFPRPLNFQNIIDRDCEIRVSQQRLSGQTIDYWTQWLFNDFLEVNTEYGEINSLKLLNNNIYFIQEDAIGVQPIKERETKTDISGSIIVTGTGDLLGRYGYIDTKYGTKHKTSIVLADTIYGFDIKRNKFWKFTGNNTSPLSDLEGLHTYLLTYYNTGNIKIGDDLLNHNSGVCGIHDIKNNRIIWSILTGSEYLKTTVSYNILMQAFESFFDFFCGIFHVNGNRLISQGNIIGGAGVINPDLNKLYIHDTLTTNFSQYSGTYYPTILEIISNPEPLLTKVYNKIEFDSNIIELSTGVEAYNETINTVQVTTSYQDSGVITLTPNDNIRRSLRTWRFYVPRNNASTTDRIRDKFMKVKLSFTNSARRRFKLYEIITRYFPTPY